MNNNGLLMITSEGELHIRESNLEKYREYMENSPTLKSLSLRNSSLPQIPPYICDLSNLLCLDLRENTLSTLPPSIQTLSSLQILKLDYNFFKSLPIELYSLQNLRNLSISHNSIKNLHKNLRKLKKLIFFDFSFNNVEDIPRSISKLKGLNMLSIQNNEFMSIPPILHKFTSLKQFSLDWLRYTQPSLPITLKGPNGEILIKSLQNLSNMNYSLSKKEDITIIKFLSHFTDFPVFSLERCGFGPISLLHKAVLNNDFGIVAGLVQAGCDIDLLDSEGLSCLVLSIRDNFMQIARLLLKSGCNVNIGGGIYGSALHLAVAKNEASLVTELLDLGCRLDQRNCDGNTVIHILMINFNKEKEVSQAMGESLIKAGAEVNAMNRDNWAPLHIASRKSQNSAISWVKHVNKSKLAKLVTFDVNVIGGKQEWTPLHLAAHSGLFITTKKLLKVGCDIFAKNKMGKTAKDVAKGNIALYKFLTGMEKILLLDLIKKNENVKFKTRSMEKNEYGKIYEAFRRRDAEKIKEVVENKEDSPGTLEADGVYLIGRMMERHPKSYLKKCCDKEDILVVNEALEALSNIKLFERMILSPKSIIGPRASLGSQVRKVSRRLSEFHED